MTTTQISGSWINGAPVSTSGRPFDVINPATGAVAATYALATPADVDAAVAAARAAQPTFIAEEVAQCGKPVRLATEFDVPGSIDNVSFFAGAARHLEGKATAEYSADHTSSVRREAVGVVATITPWNYPLQMAVWKVIPALAAGCAVVIKPAEITPLTTMTLARVAKAAGLPDGVLNVVTGSGADVGTALAGHPDVDVVTFTGSTGVGRKVMA
ncbi:MAG: aldehyde dehydrogenase family protein, partial [Mycobacterium sp.]